MKGVLFIIFGIITGLLFLGHVEFDFSISSCGVKVAPNFWPKRCDIANLIRNGYKLYDKRG